MSRYRVRWNDCHNNFWTKWKAQPYHIGKTCKEYKKFKKAIKCRFWGNPIEKNLNKTGAFKEVWNSEEWINKISGSWNKIHSCGHPCKGFYGESDWLPWLHPDCVEQNPELTLESNDDTFCSIWFISGLGDSPSIQLGCKHIFHVECISEKLRQKWAGPRITFLFKTCPSWKAEIDAPHHPEISALIEEACKLEDIIKSKAIERGKVEGLDKDKRLSNPKDEYYNDPEKYAMARLSYYEWFKCKSPFFGGLKDWGNLLEANPDFKPEELVWGKCSSVALGGKDKWITHGTDYIEFKWRYCWSISQWFWFGTTHFCDPCHRKAGSNTITKWPGKDKWGLQVDHPDDGTEFALGCGLCRNKAQLDY